MKLRSANVLRTFFRHLREECANHYGCEGCAFHQTHCIFLEKPRHWYCENVLERYERVPKK